MRASATFLGFSGHGNVGDFRYDGHVRLRNFGGTIDLHPLGGGLRVSAGLRSTDANKITFSGHSRTSQTYGNVTFTPDQAGTLSGTIHTASVAPLVTAGYSHATLSGITFGIDGGVMFHGRPRADDFVATGQLATNAFAQAGRLSAQQQLRDKIEGYRYYPVLQLSLGYRF